MLYLYFLLNIVSSDGLFINNFAWDYYSNVQCRDNENVGLDWWFIYKPANGANFTYIASDLATQWRPSSRAITDNNNMLFQTLAPMYMKTSVDRVAVMVFENKDSDEDIPGSSTRGVLMADDGGGLYLGYSVPFLTEVAFEPKFPSSELPYGHLITCISLSTRTLNEFATYLKHAGPELVSLEIPNSLMTALPAWVLMKSNSADSDWLGIPKTPLQFSSKQSTIHGKLSVRIPGQKLCLYTEFAKQREVILDVYGPSSKHKKNFCDTTYGVRSIPSISVNIRDERVRYIDKKADRTRFALSTASNWQHRGSGGIQYWTCTSGLDRDDNTSKGGILLCIASYEIWTNFDTLKVKEPECPRKTN